MGHQGQRTLAAQVNRMGGTGEIVYARTVWGAGVGGGGGGKKGSPGERYIGSTSQQDWWMKMFGV